ncbi:MAG: ATP-binding cassette domain-containing protein [Bacilli bacterium]|jgi:ABC-2 type transport system ATP-binding protein|nr:ATP-binding cassette domain-containing protein [Bacilli bacterium]
MISLRNVSKKYKNIDIFNNVSIDFPTGKKILIKGINGVGKSVLLRLITGYATSDEGMIIIDNYTLKKDCDFIKDAGISINAPEFNKNESGLDNLVALAKIRKIVDIQGILSYVSFFKMSDVINKKYRTYSLGIKQKMRIIQALMDKPSYLILDEPFDALDIDTQKRTTDLLNKYVEINKNVTIIYTTHNEAYQDDFADIIYEITNRKIEVISDENN